MTKDSLFSPIAPVHNNVVSLKQLGQNDAPDQFPACRDLQAYWEALRGTRQMPARSEFDPRGIEQSLASTFVAEKVAPSVARIRVAGSVMADMLGMDVRGMPITAFFDPMSRDALSEATRDLFTSPALITADLTARAGFGRKPIKARLLLLPMSDGEGNISRLVGCFDFIGGLGKVPRRFQITAVHRAELSGDAPITSTPRALFSHQAVDATAPKPAPRYAFAETPAKFEAKKQAIAKAVREKGGLRLVVCND